MVPVKDCYKPFYDESIDISAQYPKLILHISDDGVPIIEGILVLTNDRGEFIDQYEIRIAPTEEYPKRYPLVFGLDNKIPVNIDWHVYESDGHFCICTVPEEVIKCVNGIGLFSFIEEGIKPYLFNQTHRRLKGYFLKERAHGFDGEYEFYSEAFKTRDSLKIIQHLIFISKKNPPVRTALCFCGSSIKYRYCHREAFQLFSKLDSPILSILIRRIATSTQFKSAYPELAKEMQSN